MHLAKNKKRCQTEVTSKGFTLIEVMVVCVIVAILASIAYPSYQNAVRRAKRTEAQSMLMQLMQQQERYYSKNNSYIAFSSNSTDENEKKFPWFSGTTAEKSAYEFSGAVGGKETECSEGIESCIVLTAKPGTSKVDENFKDPACGDISLTSKGKKMASENATDCWR